MLNYQKIRTKFLASNAYISDALYQYISKAASYTSLIYNK